MVRARPVADDRPPRDELDNALSMCAIAIKCAKAFDTNIEELIVKIEMECGVTIPAEKDELRAKIKEMIVVKAIEHYHITEEEVSSLLSLAKYSGTVRR